MLNIRTQQLLSIIHAQTCDMEPILGASGERSSGRNPRSEITNGALGFVSLHDPLEASLLAAVYLEEPQVALSDYQKQRPFVIKPMAMLALTEVCFLVGSSRCGCHGRNKICDMCGGSGIRPNKTLSERARIRAMNYMAAGSITRYSWRTHFSRTYEKELNFLLNKLSDGSRHLMEAAK